ncbi:unnamed protein product, partial [Ectocarpus fasciculatus]
SASASASSSSSASKLETVRDFIHDSLYNRAVGYFERNVNILKPSPGKDIKFSELKDQQDYVSTVRRLYQQRIEELSADKVSRDLYQLWHTPSTIFRPYYGRGIGKCILSRWDGSSPLVVYEVGPGNGSLCEDILGYFQDQIPEHMDSIEYNFIEISKFQAENILAGVQSNFPSTIRIHNMSFLDWQIVEKRKSFVIAMEVFDNLAHDVVRLTEQSSDGGSVLVEQGMVASSDRSSIRAAPGIDQSQTLKKEKKYEEVFVPLEDSLMIDLISTMDAAGHKWYSQKGKNKLWDIALNLWPFNYFQTSADKEFIPSGSFMFMKTLVKFFPRHCFIMSDFDYLPPTVSAYNGPVVQTRYKGKTVGSSTYLLQKGLCDIFFSTDFYLLEGVYKRLYAKELDVEVLKHREFCEEYTEHSVMKTSSGYNPILDDFSNVSFL